jgi:hypothetical protein
VQNCWTILWFIRLIVSALRFGASVSAGEDYEWGGVYLCSELGILKQSQGAQLTLLPIVPQALIGSNAYPELPYE